MNPGRELDRLVAEKVMDGIRFQAHSILAVDVSAKTFTLGGDWEYPRYSAEISAAWEVIEKLRPELCIEIMPWGDNYHVRVLSVTLEQKSRASYRSAPHAICIAALKAVGHEFKESTEEL